MAISGTQTFNLEIVDIIEDAYERAGLKLESGYDFRTGRRAIDLLMLEWQNRNIDIWMVEELYWDAYNDGGPGSDKIEAEALWNLTNDVSEYQVRTGTVELLDVVIRTGDGAGTTAGTDKGKFSTDWSDTRLNRLSERAYATIQNKQTRASTGATPTSYYVKTHEILDVSVDGDGATVPQKMSIELYPSPGTGSGESGGADFNLIYWRTKRIADTGTPGSNTIEVPGQYLPALVSGLAYNVALKHGEVGGRIAALKTDYDEQIMLLGKKASVNNEGQTVVPVQQTPAPQQYPVVKGRDGGVRIVKSTGRR